MMGNKKKYYLMLLQEIQNLKAELDRIRPNYNRWEDTENDVNTH